MELDNRELASLIWLIVFSGWALSVSSIRDSIKSEVAAFLQPAISVSLILMASYVTLVVLTLQRIGFWEVSQLKATIVWTFAFAFLTLLEISKISQDVSQLKKTLWGVISLTVVIIL